MSEIDAYVRLSKVVSRLGVSRRVAYYWARHGLLPGAIQIGTTWLIRVEDLQAYLTSKHLETKKWSESISAQTANIGTPKSKLAPAQSESAQESPQAAAIRDRLKRQVISYKQNSAPRS